MASSGTGSRSAHCRAASIRLAKSFCSASRPTARTMGRPVPPVSSFRAASVSSAPGPPAPGPQASPRGPVPAGPPPVEEPAGGTTDVSRGARPGGMTDVSRGARPGGMTDVSGDARPGGRTATSGRTGPGPAVRAHGGRWDQRAPDVACPGPAHPFLQVGRHAQHDGRAPRDHLFQRPVDRAGDPGRGRRVVHGDDQWRPPPGRMNASASAVSAPARSPCACTTSAVERALSWRTAARPTRHASGAGQ